MTLWWDDTLVIGVFNHTSYILTEHWPPVVLLSSLYSLLRYTISKMGVIPLCHNLIPDSQLFGVFLWVALASLNHHIWPWLNMQRRDLCVLAWKVYLNVPRGRGWGRQIDRDAAAGADDGSANESRATQDRRRAPGWISIVFPWLRLSSLLFKTHWKKLSNFPPLRPCSPMNLEKESRRKDTRNQENTFEIHSQPGPMEQPSQGCNWLLRNQLQGPEYERLTDTTG